MADNYFSRAKAAYGTRLWINNPTMSEAKNSLTVGAISCTTNPAYCMKMFQSEDAADFEKLAAQSLDETGDIAEAARLLQRKAIARLLPVFLPLYKAAPDKQGFVSIQCDPTAEFDPDMLIKEALLDRELGINVIAKIPTTSAGLVAMEYLAARGVPMIATEIMGISQMIRACETYKKASALCSSPAALYVTHITGIFDQYFAARVKELNVDIPEELLAIGGTMIAHRQYKMMCDRGYPGIVLGGGARHLGHFTCMVGGPVDITINWKGTLDKILELDPPLEDRLHDPVDETAAKELMSLLPEYAMAYEEDGMKPEEFEDFGPVVLFRNSFLNGWNWVLDYLKNK